MTSGYKKYMKKNVTKDYPLWKLFAFSFFGMLLVFTFLITSFSPKVDTSIGDYKQEVDTVDEAEKVVDDRLSMIQDEDQGRNFSDLMKNSEDQPAETTKKSDSVSDYKQDTVVDSPMPVQADAVYKVFIGSYTSAEQARVAKDIITETGINLTPIVKCIGSNNYTLQVGIFKNKSSADALLSTVQQNHLPGRIVQEY